MEPNTITEMAQRMGIDASPPGEVIRSLGAVDNNSLRVRLVNFDQSIDMPDIIIGQDLTNAVNALEQDDVYAEFNAVPAPTADISDGFTYGRYFILNPSHPGSDIVVIQAEDVRIGSYSALEVLEAYNQTLPREY